MNRGTLSVVCSLLLLASPSCFADAQISFVGIDGEVKNAAFPNAIPVTSVTMGASVSTSYSTGTLSTGKPVLNEISFTKARGIASAGLEKALFSGLHLSKAQLRITRPGTTNAYLLVTLEDVLVKSWQTSVDDSGSAMDSFSIVFARIRTEDVITNADGTKTNVPAGWDAVKALVY